MSDVFELIKMRRAIFPPVYTQEPIAPEVIWELLDLANYAPTHRRTEPWRFRVLHGLESRQKLADVLVQAYEAESGSNFSEFKAAKMRNNPPKAGAIIALAAKLSPNLLPEWEEVAALAMAVQNMWLAAAAKNLGAYWSSPATANHALVRDYLGWEAEDKAYGFFYLGHHQTPLEPAQRGDIKAKVRWL